MKTKLLLIVLIVLVSIPAAQANWHHESYTRNGISYILHPVQGFWRCVIHDRGCKPDSWWANHG